jgi:hypothetical protein
VEICLKFDDVNLTKKSVEMGFYKKTIPSVNVIITIWGYSDQFSATELAIVSM